MPELFERTEIKSLQMANRSMRSATWSGVGDARGYVTDKAVAFYSRLAGGGIGLIVTGYQHVMPNGQQLPFKIGNYDDDQLEGLSRLASAVHAEGGRIATQLVHACGRSDPGSIPPGAEVWAPSPVPDPTTGRVPKEMTKSDIAEMVEAFAAAASRSKRAGFDAIQLHGAHGYGINQFLSPAWNQRGDAYGGSLSNRYRVLGEVMEATRGAVGDDFPVLIKLNGHDYLDKGLELEESLKIASRLQDDGIDMIEVSGGSMASYKGMSPARTRIAKQEDEAYLSNLATAIKRTVSVPVATVGGIRSLSTIQGILSDRIADYISMSRPFIREPHLMNRWKSGDEAKATCVSCNGCFETGVQGLGISCKLEREKQAKERE